MQHFPATTDHLYRHYCSNPNAAIATNFIYMACILKVLSTFDKIVLFQNTKEIKAVAAAAKSLQSCPTLCDPIDGSPPGSPVPGILQARTLEWVAISFSNAWKWKVKVKSQSCPTLRDPMDRSPPGSSVHGFSRQEYWSGVPSPSPD